MLFERFITLDWLHVYKSFMKSSTDANGPDRSLSFLAFTAAAFKRAAASSLGCPQSSTSRSTRRPSTLALAIKRIYDWRESKPFWLAKLSHLSRVSLSIGTCSLTVLMLTEYRMSTIMSILRQPQSGNASPKNTG